MWIPGAMLEPGALDPPLLREESAMRCYLPHVRPMPPRASCPLLQPLLREEILPAQMYSKEGVPTVPSLLPPMCGRVWPSIPEMLPSLLPLQPLPSLQQVLHPLLPAPPSVRPALYSAMSL